MHKAGLLDILIGSALSSVVALIRASTRSMADRSANREAFVPEDFGPIDSSLSLRSAVELYRSILEDRTDVDVDDVSPAVERFTKAANDQFMQLIADVVLNRQEVEDCGTLLKQAEDRLIAGMGERRLLKQDVKDAKTDLEMFQRELRRSQQALEEFKRDKRMFLADYLNSEFRST